MNSKFSNPSEYQGNKVTSSFLSLRLALVLMAGELILGISGYTIIEGYTLREAFYMTILAISTVGFTEVQPLSPTGQVFSSVLIMLNIGIFAYLISVFTYYVIQGEIFKKMNYDLIQRKIGKLKDHVIICGYGKYGKEIAIHLLQHDIPFVIIDDDPDVIEGIRQDKLNLLFIHADATLDDTLKNAGIDRAEAIISALPEDSENVYIVITAKNINPTINIISRASQIKSQKTLLLAGATHVIMPEQIGGFYMATLVSKPGAVEFFSFITRDMESDISFEELKYEDMPEGSKNKTLKEMNIRSITGANVIGYINPNNNYIVNPGPDAKLEPNSSFIVLGSTKQLEALKELLDNYPS
ncbi:MAG: potassium channel protein [Bacteroidetes bacterium]|nr:MAG: potassium channel protein [Bacteroidota bacterium]